MAAAASDEDGVAMSEAPPLRPGDTGVKPAWQRPKLVLGVIAVLVVIAGLAITYKWAVLDYEPITSGGLYVGPSPSSDNYLLESPGGDTAMLIPGRAGKEFSLEFNIANRGARAVRVTAFPSTFWTHPSVERLGVRIGDGRSDGEVLGGGAPAGLIDFEPFTLGPKQHRFVSMRYRFKDCPFQPFDGQFVRGNRVGTGLASASWKEQRVEYEVLGVSRKASFALPVVVSLLGGSVC